MSTNSATSITFEGADQLTAALQGMPAAIRSGILARSVKKAAQPIAEAMRRMAPRRTGSLRASIAVKVVEDSKKGTAMAIIGPDRNYYSGTKKLSKYASKQGANKPANYAHLVEFGHHTAARSGVFGGMAKGSSRKRGKNTSHDSAFVLPQPFIRPGFFAGAPAAEAIMVAEIGAAVTATRKKMISTGAHAA